MKTRERRMTRRPPHQRLHSARRQVRTGIQIGGVQIAMQIGGTTRLMKGAEMNMVVISACDAPPLLRGPGRDSVKDAGNVRAPWGRVEASSTGEHQSLMSSTGLPMSNCVARRHETGSLAADLLEAGVYADSSILGIALIGNCCLTHSLLVPWHAGVRRG